MRDIESRLQRLERELRRSRQANRLLLMGAVAVFSLAYAQGDTLHEPQDDSAKQVPYKDTYDADGSDAIPADPLRTIEAGQLLISDRSGRTRIRLGVSDTVPEICLLDEQGRRRMQLRQNETGSELQLLDAEEIPRVLLHLPDRSEAASLQLRSASGNASIKADGVSIRDAAGQTRLLLSLTNGNFPVLGISQKNQNGPPSIEMTAGDDGSRRLAFHDSNGFSLFSVASSGNGTSALQLLHPDHDRSLQISQSTIDGEGPTIACFAPANEDGTGGILPHLQLGLHNDAAPFLRILHRDGRPAFTAPEPRQ